MKYEINVFSFFNFQGTDAHLICFQDDLHEKFWHDMFLKLLFKGTFAQFCKKKLKFSFIAHFLPSLSKQKNIFLLYN